MRRRSIPELMDDPALATHEHHRALQSLNRANSLFRFDSRLFKEAVRLAGSRSISVLDLGCGGGGFLNLVGGTHPPLNGSIRVGIDPSFRAISAARRWSNGRTRWVAGDARRLPFADSSFDVVVSSLLLHHLDRNDVPLLLREAARVARVGIVMSDLTRSGHSLALTWSATRILSRSHVFHVDGPRSVRAAWTPRELRKFARQAGLTNGVVRRQFPFRMILSWRKTDAEKGRE